MANNDNLKPFNSNQSREEAKKNGRKGGKISGKVRRQKKTMREMLDYLLNKEITNKQGEKATTLEAVMVATIKKALTGDTRAAEFIRDTIGEKPVDKQLTVEGTKEDLEIVIDKKGIQAEIEKTRMLADE